MKRTAAVVLGGYVNGYSIIQELYENNIYNIALFDYGNSIASYSNKISFYKKIDKTYYSLRLALEELNKKYSYIIIFPTDDLQLENLLQINSEIKDFCFIPFNVNNFYYCIDKFNQYKACKELGVPYPKTIYIQRQEDILNVCNLTFPVIIKPNKRDDLKINVFRSLILNSKEDFLLKKNNLSKFF